MHHYSDVIAFATEPVFVSLANVLGYYDNLPSPLPIPIKVNYMCAFIVSVLEQGTILLLCIHVHVQVQFEVAPDQPWHHP